ncbi:MAG: transketolase [Candidatus Buchananbacteria bacterium]
MSEQINYQNLAVTANNIRQEVIKMLLAAKSGHSAGSLGMADVFTALYFNLLKVDPKKPHWSERDRLVLSNAHICPVLYATLAERGFFSKKELVTLRKLGSRLQGHSTFNHGLPGIETSGGPLGQGLSQAIGLALARQLDKQDYWVYCLMSDGELDEGQSWEAIMFAAKHKLTHLTAIVDRNNIQIGGPTEQVMPLEPLADKWRAFGWQVIEIDGNNLGKIIEAGQQAKVNLKQPTVILAKTIPGKGVSFMENNYQWHGKAPNEVEAKKALAELQILGKQLAGKFL